MYSWNLAVSVFFTVAQVSTILKLTEKKHHKSMHTEYVQNSYISMQWYAWVQMEFEDDLCQRLVHLHLSSMKYTSSQ